MMKIDGIQLRKTVLSFVKQFRRPLAKTCTRCHAEPRKTGQRWGKKCFADAQWQYRLRQAAKRKAEHDHHLALIAASLPQGVRT
jgi:hypothetical protein